MLHYLNKNIVWFPQAEEALSNGLIAQGGDLTPEWLLEAYSKGIFPWFNSDDFEISWWCPDPRFVLFPKELKLHRSLKQVMKKKLFTVTFDTAFEQVILECAQPRKKRIGTWITKRMKAAYISLHKLGYAHSVEVWHNGVLAGGLYGVSLGKAFFGESMFTRVDNASKIALVTLVHVLHNLGFYFVDCQVYTHNLNRFGARFIPRKDFLALLNASLEHPTIVGSWEKLILHEYAYIDYFNEVKV